MGIILSALAGAGDAGVQSMNQNIDQMNKLDLMQQQSALQLQNETQLAQAKADIADQVRQRQAANIQSGMQPILDQGVINKAIAARSNQLSGVYASDAGPSNGGFHGNASQILSDISAMPDGPDKTAALAQLKTQVAQNASAINASGPTMDDLTDDEKAKFAPSMEDKTNAYLQSAMQLGYMDPKDVASLRNSDLRRETQMAINSNKYDTLMAIANLKGDFAMQLQAMKGAAGGTDKVMAHNVFMAGEQAIRDNNTNIGQLQSELRSLQSASSNLRPKSQEVQDNVDRQKAVTQQIDDLRARIPLLQDRQQAIAAQFGFDLPPIPRAPSAAPAPAPAPSGQPSGGKPVTLPPLNSFYK